MGRPRGRLQQPAEREQRRHLKCKDDHDRDEYGGEVHGRWKRSGTDAFEDADLASRDERDRESGEGRVRSAVADHPGEQRPRGGATVDATVVDRGQKGEEEDGEEEDEHRRLAAAPEEALLPPQLMAEEPHSSCAAVRERYTSSSVGRRTDSPSSSRPSASASAVNCCNSLVGSVVWTTTSRPSLR